MRGKKAHIRAVPVRVTPVTAAVATALGSFVGMDIAAAATPEVVVSATRRDTSLQDVPYSISAISKEDLQKLQIDDLSGVAQWSAGLTQVDQGARDGNLLLIRGINSNAINSPEFLNNSTGERVATYYGETPVYINLQPIDIERVEILRGPQGTVFGARSLAGAVRYIPSKPDTTEFSIDSHIRGYDTKESDDFSEEADIVINAPLIEDTLALRALLGYSHKAGFIDYKYLVPNPGVSCPEPGYADPGCSSDGFNAEDDADNIVTRSYGMALLWRPTEALETVLSWRHQNRYVGGRQINSSDALGLIEANRGINLDNGNYVSGMRFTEPSHRENDVLNLTVVWDTPLGELTSSTSYTSYEQHGRRDQTDLLLDLEPDGYYYYEEFPAFAAFTDETFDDEFLTQEIRMVSDQTEDISWLVGAFFQDADLFSRSMEITPGYAAWDPFFTTANGDIEYDNKTFQKTFETALFGEIGFDLTDTFNILFGARWFDYEAQIRSCTAFPIATTGFGGSPDVDDPSNCDPMIGFEKSSESDVLGKFSASLQLQDELTGYFTFSQGYSTGRVNTRYDFDSEKYVEPEKTDNYEIGIKGSAMGKKLVYNAALFYIDWIDIQVDGRTLAGSRLVRNVGKAESKGMELDALLRLTDNLEIAAGYSYVNAELSKGCDDLGLTPAEEDQICGPENVDTASGDRLPGSPEHSGFLRATWVQPLSSDIDLNVNYGITMQSDVFTKFGVGGSDCCRDNGEKLGGFALHNVSAGLATETWRATFFVENLFDKYAVTGVREDQSTLGTAGPPPDFTLRRYFQNVVRPRTMGVDIRYRFR